MNKITLISFLAQFAYCTLWAQWSNPITVLPNTAQPSYIEGENDVTSPVIHATTDQKGVMHVVWSDLSNGINEIYYSRKTTANGSFSTPINLSNTADNYSLFPDIVEAPSGVLMVSWTDIDQDFTVSKIQVRMLGLDGTWSEVTDIEQPTKLCIFSSGAYLDEGNHFLLAYSEITLSGDGSVEAQGLGMSKVALSSGEATPFDKPLTSPEPWAFRPKLLNQGPDTVHCIWYDEIGEGADFIKYVAYSALQNGTWTATTPISTAASSYLWDDGPLHLILDNNQSLCAIWMSYIPETNGQMVVKPLQGNGFDTPTNITDKLVFNGAFYFDPANQLNMVHPFDKGLYHYRMDNGTLALQDTLVAPNSEVFFPAAHTAGDTVHLFWAQGTALRYSTNVGTSNTGELFQQAATQVFPTLSSGTVHITAAQEITQVDIFGENGQLVAQQRPLGTHSTTIHLTQVPAGRYVAKLTLKGNEQVTHKFLLLR